MVGLVGLVGCFAAGTSRADDLLALYNAALESDPQLETAALEKKIGRREFWDGLFAYFPRVTAQYDKKRRQQRVISSENTVFSLGKAHYDLDQAFAELRQPVFDWEAVATARRGKALERQAAAKFAAAQQLLILRVAEAYFDILSAEEKMRLLTAADIVTGKELSFIRERLDAGLALRSEAKDVEAQKALTESELVDARNEVSDNFEALSEIVGYRPAQVAAFARFVPTTGPAPTSQEDWVRRALENNNDLLAQQFAVDVAKYERAQIHGENLPKLEVVGTYDYLDQEGSLFGGGSKGDDLTIGLRVSVPIFNAKGEGYQGRKQTARRDVEVQKLDQLRRRVARETKNFFRQVAGAQRKVRALDEAVEATAERLRESREERKAGKATTVDVLKAQRENLRAQRDLFVARIDYVVNTLKLKSRAGILSERDVHYLNAFLVGG